MTSWRGILFCNTRNQLKIPLQEVLYAIFYEIQFKMTASFKISIFILLISYLQIQPFIFILSISSLPFVGLEMQGWDILSLQKNLFKLNFWSSNRQLRVM